LPPDLLPSPFCWPAGSFWWRPKRKAATPTHPTRVTQRKDHNLSGLLTMLMTIGLARFVMMTTARVLTTPAMKLFHCGLSDGRYRNPDPAECSGMMKTSYFPGGRPEPPAVVLGFSPCGGGGGGGWLMVCEGPAGPEPVRQSVERGGVVKSCGL
jgi:hypothetical protein